MNAFQEIRRFLEQNPSEIVLLILQDSTSSKDTVSAFEQAGLDQFAYTHEAGDPWPTLAGLIRQATPLIVMSERHGNRESWLHSAFEFMSDTPYDTSTISDLNCELNRGKPENDLLLLNAWINEPLPSRATARKVNDKDNLTTYAKRCQNERGRTANVVAVNFWQEGGLIDAVADINKLGTP